MSLIDHLNELIDYSMGFPFYQRLNPLFNGISNKDAPLSNGRSILARPTQGPSLCPSSLYLKGSALPTDPKNRNKQKY